MVLQTSNFIRKKGIPLYEQIYQKLRDDILNGYLKKNDRMPSIRVCEKLFNVSKTSIERAYLQLQEEGFIRSQPQAGYFVDVDEEHAKLRRTLFMEETAPNQQAIRFDFRSQSMDADAFDRTLWKKYLKEALERQPEISTYGDAQGELPLRRALQKYAYSARGVVCDVDAMLIGASFQSLLFLLCGLLTQPVVVGMEESGFAQAETVFRSYGFPIVRLRLHGDGVDIEELKEKKVTLLYLNSGSCGKDHQPVHKQKKAELLQWAKAYNACIIEDDHNGELRYVSRVFAAMQGFDTGDHVFYLGSFSRVLLPSLRISYLVLTQAMQERYQQAKAAYSPTSSKIEQFALARYITDGHLERHVRRLKKRYEKKSSCMKEVLLRCFPEAVCILEEASLQFILRFPYPLDSARLLKEAAKDGLALNVDSMEELIVSFAAIPQEQIIEAVQQLRSVVDRVHR